jgi:DNA polymerase III epsilon subunit-like protein
MPIILAYDTETTGKPPQLPGQKYAEGFFKDAKVRAEAWPRIVQLSFILYDTDRMKTLQMYDSIIRLRPEQYPIPPESTAVHGISNEKSQAEGIPILTALLDFMAAYQHADFVVGHNIQYDINVVLAEITLVNRRKDEEEKRMLTRTASNLLQDFKDKMGYDPKSEFKYCTMQKGKVRCDLPRLVYGEEGPIIGEDGQPLVDYTLDKSGKRQLRGPRLEDAHKLLFHQKANGTLHNSLVDVAVTLRIYMELDNGVDICKPENRTVSNEAICALIAPSHISKDEMPRTVADERMVEVLKVDHLGDDEHVEKEVLVLSSPRRSSRLSAKASPAERLTIGDEAALLSEAARSFEENDESVARGVKKRATKAKSKTRPHTKKDHKSKGKGKKSHGSRRK